MAVKSSYTLTLAEILNWDAKPGVIVLSWDTEVIDQAIGYKYM